MKHSRRYVAFGYKSEHTDTASGGEILHVHQAIHAGSATEVYSRLTKLLRQIINHQCEESREHAQPTSGKTGLARVGRPVDTNSGTTSHHSDSDAYGLLKVSGVPARQVSR